MAGGGGSKSGKALYCARRLQADRAVLLSLVTDRLGARSIDAAAPLPGRCCAPRLFVASALSAKNTVHRSAAGHLAVLEEAGREQHCEQSGMPARRAPFAGAGT